VAKGYIIVGKEVAYLLAAKKQRREEGAEIPLFPLRVYYQRPKTSH
jgi:hypothetical protein